MVQNQSNDQIESCEDASVILYSCCDHHHSPVHKPQGPYGTPLNLSWSSRHGEPWARQQGLRDLQGTARTMRRGVARLPAVCYLPSLVSGIQQPQ